jgi:hypothetical protein
MTDSCIFARARAEATAAKQTLSHQHNQDTFGQAKGAIDESMRQDGN